MGKVFDGIDEKLAGWIRRQRLFFVGTAPIDSNGHVNVSPKGPIGSLAVLDGSTVAYLDVIGSGVETIAHLRENGRVVVMLCAFEGPPRIVRLHGRGEVVEADDGRFAELARACGFAPGPNARAIVRVELDRISDSCGYGVPLMDYVGERPQQDAWVDRKLRQGETALADYVREHNARSVDGLPGIRAPSVAWAAIIGADWSKDVRRRAAWVALPDERVVRPLDAEPTVPRLVAAARRIGRAVLIGVDTPIGVPRSYLAAGRAAWGLDGAPFPDWLAVAVRDPSFFEPVLRAEDWSVRTPFFRIPGGKGSRGDFERAAAGHGVELFREVDRQTHASSMFALGIPGQVAPAMQALWRELVEARALGLRLWPFDGELEALVAEGVPVAAEIYPRSAYETAVGYRVLKKGDRDVRRRAIDDLLGADWVAAYGVRVQDVTLAAVGSEDDFDACLTCAALLRLVLEGRPLAGRIDPEAEGAMLGV